MRVASLNIENNSKFYIMGILNVTPDSFSDGGKYNNVTAALEHTEELLSDGADIIDIGAESTRPGHEKISSDEEIARLLPILKAVRQSYPKIPVSVDCYRASTARAALDAGADMINDIWGLSYDPWMAALIREYGAAVCIMHNRQDMNYKDLMSDIKTDLSHMLLIARDAGIDDSQICIDPGIGFAKTAADNLAVLKQLDLLQSFNLPVLLGTSRKGFLGKLLNNVEARERDLATAVTSALAYDKGCRIFRVHDVKKTKEALIVAEAIAEADDGLR